MSLSGTSQELYITTVLTEGLLTSAATFHFCAGPTKGLFAGITRRNVFGAEGL